jgi:hypothetical protein
LLLHCSFSQAGDDASQRISAATRNTQFHLYSNANGEPVNVTPNSVPSEFVGAVIDAWRADSASNRRACLSKLLFDRVHESLCASLSKHKVLALRVEGISSPVIALVYLPQSARIGIGDRIRVHRGAQRPDGSIAGMPQVIGLAGGAQVSFNTTNAIGKN